MKRVLAVAFAMVIRAGAAGAALTCSSTEEGTPTYATWNPADTGAINLTGGNLITGYVGTIAATRSTVSRSTGKWYWEVTTTGANGGVESIGVSTAGVTLSNYVGSSASGAWGYYSDGRRATAGSANFWGASSYASGDVIGIALDAATGAVWFSKNGTWQGGGNPAAGTGAAFTGMTGGPFFASTSKISNSQTANFGASAMAYTAPSGFHQGFYNAVEICHGQFVCSAATSSSCSAWVDAFPEDRATFDELGLTGEAIGLSFAAGLGLALAMFGLSLAFGSGAKIIRNILGAP